MNKLIALSLAAASSLVISNAMALPASFGQTIRIQNDGGNPHQATCYLVANNDGVGGSCDYECEEAGQLQQSPTLSLMLREQKALPFVNCNVNRTRIVPTLLQFLPGSMIFDRFEYPALVQVGMGQEGGLVAARLDADNVWTLVSITA